MEKRKIFFLGETYRTDAITWMDGLKKFGSFDIITWELKTPSRGIIPRMFRIFEYAAALFKIRKLVKKHKPDMVIAERTTSYGFLAALSGVHPIAIAQQGITDLWPQNSPMLPVKKVLQNYAYKKADLIHAWGSVIAASMEKEHVDMRKVLVMPKGVRLDIFENQNKTGINKISAIVTRSLSPEYRHETILRAFGKLHREDIDFSLLIAGDGFMLEPLKELSKKLGISDKVTFLGRVPNAELPELLNKSCFYISMPVTEGVSSSLYEAMATGCYPILSDIPGNRGFVRHRDNGQLVSVDNSDVLADEILWAWENAGVREKAVASNRAFAEKNANFDVNMKLIADRYHDMINESRTTNVRH